ncbi:MAG: hypothetical protein MUE73_13395 [Planctomycetes bacterium]|jgi:hypothetical protein|nr:hypothetical protein [Planctomycetota bacterium]
MAPRWFAGSPGLIWFRSVVIIIGILLMLEESHRSWGKADPRAVVGVVHDTYGHPVAGAEIWAEPGGFQGLSGTDGTFRLTVPLKAEFMLHALPDAASHARLEPVRVPVRAGDAGVVLTVPAGGRIRLRLDPLPASPGKVWAELRAGSGASVRFGRFGADGTLDLAGLPSGDPYALEVHDEETGMRSRVTRIKPWGQEVAVRLTAP